MWTHRARHHLLIGRHGSRAVLCPSIKQKAGVAQNRVTRTEILTVWRQSSRKAVITPLAAAGQAQGLDLIDPANDCNLPRDDAVSAELFPASRMPSFPFARAWWTSSGTGIRAQRIQHHHNTTHIRSWSNPPESEKLSPARCPSRCPIRSPQNSRRHIHVALWSRA